MSEDSEYDDAVLALCLTKLMVYWVDMDMYQYNPPEEGEGDGEFEEPKQEMVDDIVIDLHQILDQASYIATGRYALLPDGLGMFNWFEALSCIEVMMEKDDLVEECSEELYELRIHMTREWGSWAVSHHEPEFDGQ